jgi:hypothetical protein
MLALLTSCGRMDLLQRTLETLIKDQKFDLDIIVHEDHPKNVNNWARVYSAKLLRTHGIGQHKSIETFLSKVAPDVKYYLHLEDDWEFENNYDWISESIRVMEADTRIIKVLARTDRVHPVDHLHKIGDTRFGYLDPWQSGDGINWHGFSWNPGVTRLDLLKQFVPFPKWEQDVAEKIYNAGYLVASLERGVYKHIGDGRSTHA